MTLITSVMWTGFGVYTTANKKADVEVPPALLEPVNPSLDTKTLEEMQTRRQLTTEVTSADVVQKAIDILLIEPTDGESPQPQPTATPAPEPAAEEETDATPEPILDSTEPTPTPASEPSL